MEPNIVAKKTRTTNNNQVIDKVKVYDEQNHRFDFFKRIIQYLKGGNANVGDWEPISRKDYDTDKTPEVTYDNHP